MIDPNSADFSAFPPNYREVEGEIVPNYGPGNGNQPRRPKKETDTMPDYEELADLTSYKGEMPPAEGTLDLHGLVVGMKEGHREKDERNRRIQEAVTPTTVRSAKPFKQ